jgi:hypothetical protein
MLLEQAAYVIPNGWRDGASTSSPAPERMNSSIDGFQAVVKKFGQGRADTVRGVIAPCGQARTHAPQPWH